MAKKNTIYDVAKKAGVAISTVSRVLNESPYVSEETKSKVVNAIKDLEFRPQVNARLLAKRQPQIIAVAVPTFTTPFFNEVLKGVKDEIKALNLDFIIYNTGSENPEGQFISFIDRGVPDALIMFSIEITDEIYKGIKDLSIPIILVGAEHSDFDSISWNNYRGGFLAAEHLISCDYKKIGMIRSHKSSYIADQREKGFKDAMKKYKIPIDENCIVSGITTKHAGFSEEAGFEAVNILNKRNNIPQALFCSNDAQAIGALHALNELGKRVPEDVAVMGYDNIKVSRYFNLTTIDQKMYEVGVQAIKLLSHRIKNKEDRVHHSIIEPELIIRKSTTR
ncbi:MAG: LacI family DNA-binding transcriptional regulator [Cyclonatronaceae bacterium]